MQKCFNLSQNEPEFSNLGTKKLRIFHFTTENAQNYNGKEARISKCL